MATCTVGPVSAIVIDVVHPGVRATGSSVLALFQNLFGLAAGPFVAGLLSDAFGLVAALERHAAVRAAGGRRLHAGGAQLRSRQGMRRRAPACPHPASAAQAA